MIIFATDLKSLIIAEFFSSLCFSIKDISDTTLLNMSIPEGNKKGEVFSKILEAGIQILIFISKVGKLPLSKIYVSTLSLFFLVPGPKISPCRILPSGIISFKLYSVIILL